jgi:cytochrome c oxidase subunit 2
VKYIKRFLSAVLVLGLFTQIPSQSSAQEEIRTIEIHAHRFSFSPSEITLKKGETVKLRLISDDVTHALFIPGLQIKQAVSKGHPAEITVTPGSAGDFRGECANFCGSGHGSMLFTAHVKD